MMLTQQRIQWILIFCVVAFFFYVLSPILSPFLFSILLAYLGDPVVDKLEKKMSRTIAVTVVYVVIFIVLIILMLVILPMLYSQFAKLITIIPDIIVAVQTKLLPVLEAKLGVDPTHFNGELVGKTLQNQLGNIPTVANRFLGLLSGSASWLIQLLTNVFLVPVVTFYLLRDWDVLVEKARSLLPRNREEKIVELCRESDQMLSLFLRGQFLVMNALGVIYAVGLTLIGLDFGILIGFIAGWLSFVPYLGLVIGIGTAGLMAIFQFADFLHPFLVVIVFVIAQALEGSVLTPRFVGEKIGLHAVAVIFAVLAGGQLAGFSGVLLALPVAAVLNVLIRHAHMAYRNSMLYND